MSFSEADFVTAQKSGAVFVKAEAYQWKDVKHSIIPFKSSPFKGQTLEAIVMGGGRDGAKHLRRLSRWSDEFIDSDLRERVRVAIKFRAAYEKWLEKQEVEKKELSPAATFYLAQAQKKAVHAAVLLPPIAEEFSSKKKTKKPRKSRAKKRKKRDNDEELELTPMLDV